MNSGKLIIRPHKAELKCDKNFFFKADPYCIFFLGTQQVKTSTCKKGGKDPIWDDVIVLDRSTEGSIIVQIWDQDTLSKDDFICEGTVDITKWLKEGVHPVTVDLYTKGAFFGQLYMDVEFKESLKAPSMSTTGTVYSEQVHVNKF